MAIFDNANFDAHEAIHYFCDETTALRAIIAIHSTALGPAGGGCRLWHYPDEGAALTDALRLSRGMTYKNAIAGLPFGGGKAVILMERLQRKSPDLFKAFGRCVDTLHGTYVTAEDVGVTTEDMCSIRAVTHYVSGLPQDGNAAGGDPSPWTAYGVLLSIKSAVSKKLGADSLQGLRIAVQGLGSVGFELCKKLHAEGAILTIADVNPANIARVSQVIPAAVVDPSVILAESVDVLAPCALGGVLNSETIPRIKAQIIAGAANNQLATESDGYDIAARGILYVPDYVANAGGMISVAREYLGGSNLDQLLADINRIPERLSDVFSIADATSRPTSVVADEMARSIVTNANGRMESSNTCA